ncbi:hypothetical protein ACFWNH_29215 [Rhodococcus qingshengii]|uniref:hypothetical protein n=1 Tax=Rhodococcus qingshengii TaxID=334542 RepID=UPI003666EB79
MTRHCIIGAGYTGLVASMAYTDLGLDYDHVQAAGAIGGNWPHGVYDSTHLISSKDVTGYPDYPMPAATRTFPVSHRLVDAPVAPSTSARNPEQPVVPRSVSRQIPVAAGRNT